MACNLSGSLYRGGFSAIESTLLNRAMCELLGPSSATASMTSLSLLEVPKAHCEHEDSKRFAKIYDTVALAVVSTPNIDVTDDLPLYCVGSRLSSSRD